jgi:hypothetical protein
MPVLPPLLLLLLLLLLPLVRLLRLLLPLQTPLLLRPLMALPQRAAHHAVFTCNGAMYAVPACSSSSGCMWVHATKCYGLSLAGGGQSVLRPLSAFLTGGVGGGPA